MNVLVIGTGNLYRSDDGLGRLAAQRLAELQCADMDVVESSGEGSALMEAWAGREHVLLIDAVQSGERPGTIHRLDAGEQEIPSDFFHYSTHAFSVAEAVEMARALGSLPKKVIVYGVEGKDFSAGTELSEAVDAALPELVERIAGELIK